MRAAKKGAAKTSKQPKRAARGGSSDLLVLEEVSKTHDGDRILFKDVSLTIRAGDKLAVAGANGAGKTTLLRLLTGQPMQGWEHIEEQVSCTRSLPHVLAVAA